MTTAPAGSVIPRNVEEEMKESYLRYSMSVIISRALPDARDGLKPSQRRILYAMRQLKLSPGGKHRKCAKICGDTSGDYHPHGEQVIYPTLARMAQPWSMRYQLIDGQGNFGSVDGDPPAAMRYTEARLTPSAVQLMDDLDKETVDLIPNYDETKTEPTVFPAKFPNLLCNGSSGIAVGMATNIPPHNLKELIEATKLVIDQPDVSIEAIMQVMPGPDFATGGLICGYRGIREAYHTGRGKLICRAKVRIEDMEKGADRQRIVVDEIPYTVNKSRLIENVAELIHKKQITGISDLRDESDKDGMRIVMELKRGEMPDVVLNQLYKFTNMQVTFGCNMLALERGMPRTMNIRQLIAAWVEHRIEVIRRRTRYELNKAEARAHVLEGYLKAIDNLDEVIKLIKASSSREDAKRQLVARFEFTERQAEAVLDLRLYQLTGLEHDKIQNELNELLLKITEYRAILASELKVREIIKEELSEISKIEKTGRRTQIVAAETDMAMEDLIADEAMVITVSEDDYVKRMPIDTFREQRRGGVGIAGMQLKREGDAVKSLYVADTHEHLLMFTNLGRVYWLKVWQIPEGGRRTKGTPLVNLLEDLRPDERVAVTLPVRGFEQAGVSILMATERGVVKKSALELFSRPRAAGIWALAVDEGDRVIAARLVHEGEQVMLFTRCGMAVRFDESAVRPMGRMARGVRGVSLKKTDDCVVGCEVVKGDETIIVVTEKGYGKRSAVEEFRQTNRGVGGVRSIIVNERNGMVVGALSVTDDQGLLMMTELGQAVRIPLKQVRVMGRSTQGVRLANLREEDRLVAIQKLDALALEENHNGTENGTEGALPTAIAAGEVGEESEEAAMEEDSSEE